VEVGAKSMALVHLANISYRAGRKLRFAPASWEIQGDAEASQLLTRAPRAPYAIPEKV
jgi:hypothetical protein